MFSGNIAVTIPDKLRLHDQRRCLGFHRHAYFAFLPGNSRSPQGLLGHLKLHSRTIAAKILGPIGVESHIFLIADDCLSAFIHRHGSHAEKTPLQSHIRGKPPIQALSQGFAFKFEGWLPRETGR
jgi:hypothetical protein